MDGFNNRFNQTEINHGKVPVELQDLGTEVCSILYYVSFGCCFLVFLGYAFIRHFDPLHDRLTVRLIVYSAIAHIFLGAAGVIRINNIGRGRPKVCNAIMFFYIFANLFSTMTITCIAVNLQVVFVHGVKRKMYLERIYLLCSFLVAFIIAVIPLFPSVSGYTNNPRMHHCWFKQSSAGTTGIWGVMGLYFWIILSTAYCFIALILVLGKMWREEFIINRHLRVQMTNRQNNNRGTSKWFYRFPWSLFFRPPPNPPANVLSPEQQRDEESVLENDMMNNHINDNNEQRCWFSNNVLDSLGIHKALKTRKRRAVRTIKMIRTRQLQVSYVAKVASRVIWFPIILILSRIWGVIDSLLSYRNGNITPFTMFMGYVSVPTQGIFLFFVFLFDPSFHHAIQSVLGRKYAPQQQEQEQRQQRNKGVDSILGSAHVFYPTSPSSSPFSTSPRLSLPISQKRRREKLQATQSEKSIYTTSSSLSSILAPSVDERCSHSSISMKNSTITSPIISAPSSPIICQYPQQQQSDQGSFNMHEYPYYSNIGNTSINNDLSFPPVNDVTITCPNVLNDNLSTTTDTAILLSPERILYPNINARRYRRNRYRLYHSDSAIDESYPDMIVQHVLHKNDDDSKLENEVLRQM